MSDYKPHETMDIITYPFPDLSQFLLVKGNSGGCCSTGNPSKSRLQLKYKISKQWDYWCKKVRANEIWVEGEGFELPVQFQCWEMAENTNIGLEYQVFLNINVIIYSFLHIMQPYCWLAASQQGQLHPWCWGKLEGEWFWTGMWMAVCLWLSIVQGYPWEGINHWIGTRSLLIYPHTRRSLISFLIQTQCSAFNLVFFFKILIIVTP